MDRLGVGGGADVAPELDGRKTPLSSPPLRGVSESKKNRLLSSPEHLSNSDRDTVSARIGRKIENSDDLLWISPPDPANDFFPDSCRPPYIVLM